MKNKFLAILLTSISVLSCNTITNIDKTYKTDTSKLLITKSPKMVLLKVNYDDSQIQKDGFKIKKFLNSDKNFAKTRLTLVANDIIQTLEKTLDIRSSYLINSPEGKNRIITMSFLDANNKVISTLMSVVDISSTKSNEVTLSYFDTILAQIALNILKGTNPNLLNTINFSDVRTALINLTGYDLNFSKFSKKDPLSVNTVKVAEYMSSNNGTFPPDTTPDLFGFGTINLTVDQLGAKVNFTDSNSEANQNTTSNSISITKITPGIWNLYVSKQGYIASSQEVKITSNQTISLNVNLIKKTQVPIDGSIGTDSHVVQ